MNYRKFACILLGLLALAIPAPANVGCHVSCVDDCSRWRANVEKLKGEELPANQKESREANDQLNSGKKNLTQAIKALTVAEAAGVGIGAANRNRDYWKAKVDTTTRQIARLKGRERYLNGEISRLETRIKEECPNSISEPSGGNWEKAIGKWRNKDGSLVFELVDLNKADREYHPGEPAKVEGYVRKVPPKWPDKIDVGDLIFISKKIEGDTLSGVWISAAEKGDCPSLAIDWSSCTLQIDKSGDTLTLKSESKRYWVTKCEWSDKIESETFTYYRVKVE
jgi:hypothetical protein